MQNNGYRFLYLIFRLALGFMFLYAGALKIWGPLAFADSIATFQILPAILISPLALALPVFECLLGLLLIVHYRPQAVYLGVMLLSSIFIIALSSAAVRGLHIDCGCFGSGTSVFSSPLALIARNVMIIGIAVMLYRKSECPP